MTIDERLEIIRETLKQGWSSHLALRRSMVTSKEMAYFRERLATEIEAYNKTRYKPTGIRVRTK